MVERLANQLRFASLHARQSNAIVTLAHLMKRLRHLLDGTQCSTHQGIHQTNHHRDSHAQRHQHGNEIVPPIQHGPRRIGTHHQSTVGPNNLTRFGGGRHDSAVPMGGIASGFVNRRR